MKILFIINSRIGGSHTSRIVDTIHRKFWGCDFDLKQTAYPGHAEKIARAAAGQGYDILVATGGDGTIHEVVNGSAGSNTPIGIIPAGSANDLATHLGIPGSIGQACDIIRSGREYMLDAIRVNDRLVLTSCGLGFPSDTIAAVRKLFDTRHLSQLFKRYFKRQLYLSALAPLLLRKIRSYRVWFTCNGKNYRATLMSLIIGNQPRLGRYFRALPDAVNNDGLMDLYMIGSGGRLLMTRHVAGTIRGRQARLPKGKIMKTDRLSISVYPPTGFFADGEIFPDDSRFDISILPRAVKVIVPERR
jgi:YegS/Rv2252/BmrU family lipid kinase